MSEELHNKYTKIEELPPASEQTYRVIEISTARKAMRKALKDGLYGSTKSLIGDYSNEEKIIATLKDLLLDDLEPEDITCFVTENGFDYQKFLYTNLSRGLFCDEDIITLSNFVYVEEMMPRKKKMLCKFADSIDDIYKKVLANGVEELKDTSYYLMVFLSMFAARYIKNRKRYTQDLWDISMFVKGIGEKVMDSEEKESVKYKGITIRLIGSNMEVLKSALTRVMQAINKLPRTYRRHLSKIGSIQICDHEAPYNLYYLMNEESKFNNKKIAAFCYAGSYSSAHNIIHFFDVDRYYISVQRLFESLCHELGHAIDYGALEESINKDGISRGTKIWEKAKIADNKSVSKYGDTNLTEDFAEFSVKYAKGLLGEIPMEEVRKNYPNRIQVLEAILDIELYNPRRPNMLSDERKLEIMRIFDKEGMIIINGFIKKKEINEICSLPSDKKVELAHEMFSKGIPNQFLYFTEQPKFIKGMTIEDIKELFELYKQLDKEGQLSILYDVAFANSICDKGKDILDFDKIKSELDTLIPVTESDEETLAKYHRVVKKSDDVMIFYRMLEFSKDEISEELFTGMIDAFISGFISKKVMKRERQYE